MRRYHLIELHEQPWYPASLRRLFQSGMGRSLTLFGAFDNIAKRFRQFLGKLRPERVLDMCTGSGDIAVSLWGNITSGLEADQRPELILSDLYPNLPAYERFQREQPGIDYCPQPVNALAPPEDAPGVRTMFNCFHHFRPDEARQILSSAAASAEGIAVLEVTRRSWVNILNTLFLLPFGAAFVTAFMVRPVRLQNLLWSLVIPIIPLQAAFDGVVSCLRTYTVAELQEMTRSIDEPGFEWKIGTEPIPWTMLEATYLFGWRT